MEPNQLPEQLDDSKGQDSKNESERTRSSRGLKIVLPKELEDSLLEAMNELKRRGSRATQDELIAPVFKNIDADWFSERIEALTPADYYFEALKEFPDAREKLLEAARRAYVQEKLGGSPKKTKRVKEQPAPEESTL